MGPDVEAVLPSTGCATDGGKVKNESAVSTGEHEAVTVTPVPPSERYRIAVPILDSATDEREASDVERLLQTAQALAHAHDGELLVVSIVLFPEQTPLSHVTNDDSVRQARTEVERLLGVLDTQTMTQPAYGAVCLAHKEPRALLRLLENRDCDAVLLGTRNERSQRRRLLRGDTVEKILARADCDVFVERFGEEPYADDLGTPSEKIQRILLAVSRGPHSGLATDIARSLALVTNARVDVMHGVPEETTADEHETATAIVDAAAHVLCGLDEFTTEVVSTTTVAEEIISRSDEYDITILGAPVEGLLEQFVFGSLPERVRRGADNTVLMAKRYDPDRASSYYRWLAGTGE